MHIDRRVKMLTSVSYSPLSGIYKAVHINSISRVAQSV
jgi:hypothetical protein